MSLPVYDSTKHHIGLAETAAGEIAVDELNVASLSGNFGGAANPTFTVPTENEVAPGARLFLAIALDSGGGVVGNATVAIDGLTFVELFDGNDATHGHHGIAGYFECPDGLAVGTDIDVSSPDAVCWGWSLAASSFLATYGFEDETVADVNLSTNADAWTSDATAIDEPALIVSLVMTKESLTSAPDPGTLEAVDQAGAFASASIAYRIEEVDGSYTLSGTLSATSFGLSVATQAFKAAATPMRGLIISGGYTRVPQRYGASPKYGSSEDQLEVAALSRYSQDDFSGGAYQERFRDDEAMFYDSQNFLPHQVDDSARTVPPLLHWINAGTIDPGDVQGVFATGGRVLIMDSDKFRFYDVATGARTDGQDPAWEIQAAAHDPADNMTYSLIKKLADSTFALQQVDPGTGDRTTLAQMPASATGPCRGIATTAGRDILIAMNATLWLGDVNDARDDVTFTRLGRLPGRWRAAVTYNGLTYILLCDSEQHTQLVSWDGTQVLPVTDFPYNFIGNCVGVYGGRLYVGGTATDVAGSNRYAEIYEVTGASLRLLKTFASEARAGLAEPTTIYDMVVHEGLLFFGTDRGYLIAYDLTRDALWPNIEIYSDSGHVIHAYNLLSTRERLFVYGFDATDGTENGFYRMAAVNADMTAAGADGAGVDVTADSYIETSEFSPEPDREKRWSQLRVVSRYAPGPTLEVSLDGGDTWAAIAASASSGSKFKKSDFDLSGLDTSESIRFRFSFAKTGVVYTELVAFTCSFLMLDSGKQAWSFSILGAEQAENLDGSYPVQDVAALRAALWSYWTDKTTLTYRDQDGTDHTVFVSDLRETQPVIGEAIDGSGTHEAFFSVTLTEL